MNKTTENRLGGELRSHQAARRLLEELRRGRYADAAQLPSELELADVLGVSRTVVRDALSDLERDGYLERVRGIGTLVIYVKTVGARKCMEADDGHVGLGQCNRRQQGVVAAHAEMVSHVFARAEQLTRVQAQYRLRGGLFTDDANQSLRLLQAVDDERAT